MDEDEWKNGYKCKYIFDTANLSEFPSEGSYFLQEFGGLTSAEGNERIRWCNQSFAKSLKDRTEEFSNILMKQWESS